MSNAVRRIDALTGVRAVAASWVLLLHTLRLLEALWPALGFLGPFARRGYLGVDLFFVLSGYILYLTYGGATLSLGRQGVGRFLWLRLARIYPVHLAVTAVVVLGVGLATLVGRRFGDPTVYAAFRLPEHVLLVQAWTSAPSPTWNGPSWSVSAEWAGYLLFPWIAAAATRLKTARAALALAALLLVGSATLLASAGRSSLDLTTRGGLVRFLVEFGIGILLARAVELRPLTRRTARYLPELLAVILATAFAAGAPDIVLAALLALLIPSLANSDGLLARALSSPALVALGQRSYALYLTHGLVLHLLEALAGGGRLSSATALEQRALMTLAAAVALALTTELTFRCIEEPARAWMRSLSLRRLIAIAPARSGAK